MRLIGNVLKPLAKSVLTSLGLTAAAETTDAAIHKKCLDHVYKINDLKWRNEWYHENG